MRSGVFTHVWLTCCCSAQALQHYSEAVKDLQHALELEPANEGFNKELEAVKKDWAEMRKQRAVLKQLDGNSNLSSKAGVEMGPHQSSSDRNKHSSAQQSSNSPQTDIAQSALSSSEPPAQSSCANEPADSRDASAQCGSLEQSAESVLQPATPAVRCETDSRPASNLVKMQSLLSSLQTAGRH